MQERKATIKDETEKVQMLNEKLKEEIEDQNAEVRLKQRAPTSKKRESEMRLAQAKKQFEQTEAKLK